MSFKDSLFSEFNLLKTAWDQWGSSRNFWHTACTLDACVTFVAAAKATWTTADPQVQTSIKSLREIVSGAHSTFLNGYLGDKKSNFENGNWWDDYGWWGIAFLKTYENFSVFDQTLNAQTSVNCYDSNIPITQDCCLQLAHDSWAVLHDHAWDTGQYGQSLPVSGGCWNHTPTDSGGGVQNTVTNNLYLTLSIRLYMATKGMAGWEDRNTQYLQAACDEFKWFSDWFLKGPNDSPQEGVGIFDQIYDEGAPDEKYRYWILERPVDGPNYNKRGEPPYEKQQWTGDQGVFLGGLIGLLLAQDAVRTNPSIIALSKELSAHNLGPDPINYIELLVIRITRAATSRLFTPQPRVLHESLLSKGLIDNFYTDMATGKGVLMRYLAYARPHISGLSGAPNYDQEIINTAEAICTYGPTEANGFGFIWDNKTDEHVTRSGTNEDQFLPIVKDLQNDNGWNFTIRTIRLDGLAAAIPFQVQMNI